MTATAAAPKKPKHGIKDVIAALGQPKVAGMLALGFGSGLPFLLTGGTFGYWLRDDAGSTLTAISFLSWVGLAYTFKFLWAPMMDRLPAPFLGALGKRRGWAMFSQLLVAAGLLLMAIYGVNGPGGLAVIGAFALLTAFASATQDIAVDAWRIEAAPEAEEQGLITSAYQLGYRIALLVTDALILIFADIVGWQMSYLLMALLMGVGLFAAWRMPEPDGVAAPDRVAEANTSTAVPQWRTLAGGALFVASAAAMYWFTSRAELLGEGGDLAKASSFGMIFAAAFAICALCCFVRIPRIAFWIGTVSFAAIIIAAFYSAVAQNDLLGGASLFWPVAGGFLATALVAPTRVYAAIIGPFIAFFRAHGAIAAVMLLMISLYRLPEFLIGPVAGPFYHDLGLAKTVVGGVRATAGLVASIVGIACGGLCAIRLGFSRTLILGAVLQGLGVAAYALVAIYGANLTLFSAAMAADNFCYAFAGVALVTYMSSLTSLGYTATQYALLSSVYTLFGKFLKGFSGVVVDGLSHTHTLMQSYAIFYVGAGAICLPALFLCTYLATRHGKMRSEQAAPT